MITLLNNPVTILDLETTGLSPQYDRITEIGLIEVDSLGSISEWSTLVNSDVPIPDNIRMITGISNTMLAGAPTFTSLAANLISRLNGKIILAHNASFDLGFLRAEFQRAGLPFESEALCTVKLSRALYPQHRKHSLSALIDRYSLPIQNRHRALGDARALWHFIQHIEREFPPDKLAAIIKRIVGKLRANDVDLDDEFADLMNL
ncbi:PolC-type DNA polymerase III [Methylotenera sp.]|uniref:3'-5' exonuclease n=1 Tax=Methylotenera sp. TaxID=2051956 RepID=UPI00272FAE87|nr:3'-5' exonuclease [Methylotenera sp.]MDP2071747.1 3'-5' exonuclease [Methylotenera sp.]MDP3006386.1 3'-5' exonuclease [Methylotenera sp.]